MRAFALAVFSAVTSQTAVAQVVPVRCIPDRQRICPDIRPVLIGPAQILRTSSNVRVTLDGRALRYEIEETFVNRGSTVGEADYLLPLPKGAAFENLALEIDGELVTGETMTSDRARGIYEEIVRKSRDPALVEWMDHGLLRTRIFPIPAGTSKRVVVRFRAVAQREGNALRIEYLGAGRTPTAPDANAAPSLTLLIPRGDDFGTPYSPTHQIDIGTPRIQNESQYREVRVRGDASRLTLLVPVRESSRAMITTLPYAPPGEDGFALITLSPPAGRAPSTPRDITFVVDVSGSMSGAKMEQAKAAGRTLLGTLTPADRFRLISFSTDVEEFRSGWTAVTDENLRAAQRWVGELRATGSTNIQGALERALEADSHRGRLGLVLFLTDGAATVGERNPDRLAELAARERGGQRVFTFGVGADVQAAMLERIALEGRGTAHFVQPTEDVEHAVGVVAQRLTAPVATNIRLRGQGITLRQMQPDGPQDLFAGQDLTLFVRYRGSGASTLTFTADTPNGSVEWSERVTLPDFTRDNAFVAKLWAVQRVGWLSAERRRVGANAELDNELRDLGTKYGIPTELTSYLVVEPGMQLNGPRPMSASAPVVDQGSLGAGGAGGRGGPRRDFDAARVASEQRAAKSLADAVPSDAMKRETSEGAIRQVSDRTFTRREGRWVDSRVKDGVRRVTVKPFSAAYFDLIAKMPELKTFLALGEQISIGGRNVVLVMDNNGVEQLSAAELTAFTRDW